MLNAERMRKVLANVTYRDGWTFTLEERDEGPVVRILAPVDDSRNEGGTVLGIDAWPSPNDRLQNVAFLRFLAWRLHRVEHHESREYLRYKGELWNDPHQTERLAERALQATPQQGHDHDHDQQD